MRTTITLEADVVERLRQRMQVSRKSFKETVNETLRAGLETPKKGRRGRFAVRPHRSPFVAGVDPEKLNQLVDELHVATTSDAR